MSSTNTLHCRPPTFEIPTRGSPPSPPKLSSVPLSLHANRNPDSNIHRAISIDECEDVELFEADFRSIGLSGWAVMCMLVSMENDVQRVKVSPSFPPPSLLNISVFSAAQVTTPFGIGLVSIRVHIPPRYASRFTINPCANLDVSKFNARSRIPSKIMISLTCVRANISDVQTLYVAFLVSNLCRDRARNNGGVSLRVSKYTGVQCWPHRYPFGFEMRTLDIGPWRVPTSARFSAFRYLRWLVIDRVSSL